MPATGFNFNSTHTVDEIFHRFHIPGMTTLYNKESWIWNNVVDSNSDPDISIENVQFQGTRAKFLLEMSRQGGFVALEDGNVLAEGGVPDVKVAEEWIKEVQQPVTITGSAGRLSKTDLGSYVRNQSTMVRNAMDGMIQKLSWLCYANPAGVLAKTTAAATIDATAAGIAVNFDDQQVAFKQFMPDMIGEKFRFVKSGTSGLEAVTPYNASSSYPGANAGYAILVSITDDNTLKFKREGSQSITVKDNDWLVLDGYGSKGTGYWMGLGGIVDDTYPLHGVEPGSYPRWKSTVKTVGTLSETEFDGPVADVADESGDLTNVCAIGNRQAINAWAHLFLAQKRYVNTTEQMTGHRIPTIQAGSLEIPWKADRYCQAKTVYILNKGDIVNFRVGNGISYLGPPGSGQMWRHNYNSNGKALDAYSMNMTVAMALGTKRRNRHAKLKNFA